MLEMRKLQVDGINRIYNAHLVQDFTKDEVRPLEDIIEKVENGKYECFAFFENHQLVGYAFLFANGKGQCMLMDYFAVVNGKRGMKYGSGMLRQLTSMMKDYSGIIFEVEHPQAAKSVDDLILRKRRIKFYLDNGLKQTAVESIVYGVHFSIIYFSDKEEKSAVQLAGDLQEIYDKLLPKRIKYQIWIA